jgi:epoxyqueuosine reductase
LKAHARHLGFDSVGVAPAVRPLGYGRYQAWLERGYQAGMRYMKDREKAREHPESILEGVRSVVVVSFVYGHRHEEAETPCSGKVARYARGGDYHELLWRRLDALLDWVKQQRPEARGRSVSDTAPLLERDFARLAGLGWVGKNTMLINRQLGSYTLLGALLLDLELEYDQPHESTHCGTCTRCLRACPTDAFPEPGVLDANRCLSYWTIEHRGAMPPEFAGKLEGWVFGCDICQEVCPWNRKAPDAREPELGPRPEWSSPDLAEWLDADPAEFRKRLKGAAPSRAKRSGLLRNAALVLGSRRDKTALPALVRQLEDDDPVVRDACAWALEQIGTDEAVSALRRHRNTPTPSQQDDPPRFPEQGGS